MKRKQYSATDLPQNELLCEMLLGGRVFDAEGKPKASNSLTEVSNYIALHHAIRSRKPKTVLEIGMAFGGSSLSILTALTENGEGGRLISIDPFQSSSWYSGIGRLNVVRSGFANSHELLEMPSYLALPQLLGKNIPIDFAYIDGMHTFDYTLLDFFYIDKLLSVDGIVGFNDCRLPAVRHVIRYVKSHRRYDEVIYSKKSYSSKTLLRGFVRRILRRPTHDHYFAKREVWEPPWNYYKRF